MRKSGMKIKSNEQKRMRKQGDKLGNILRMSVLNSEIQRDRKREREKDERYREE